MGLASFRSFFSLDVGLAARLFVERFFFGVFLEIYGHL